MTCENDKKCPLHILSLEDSPMDAELIKEYLLENFGSEIQINTVANEEDFISAISKDKYDLILSDFRLPGFNGFQALEHAKSMISFTPFICVSGVIGEEAATELLKQGATDYVSKENLGRLKQSIERALKEVKDQNDLKETHLSLIKSEERYKALTQTSFDGFLILDIEGRCLEVNDIYCKISGCSREALLSMNIKDLELDEVDKQIDAHIQKIIGKGWDKFESRHRKSDGTFFHVHNSVTFIPNEKLFICFLHDITDRKKTEKDLLYTSSHDFLTGLYNRAYFEEAKLRLDTPRQLPFSIVMGDINGLKLINDGFGHSKGDEVLIEIAKILISCCRKEDIISRIGGDEFGILLPKTDSQSAQQICNRIYDTCKGYALDGNSIYPSISLGYATKNFETETMDNILMAAEESMSRHKLLESKSAHSSIIASIKVIMFEKSQETEEHAERMVRLSKSIGLAMSLSEDQLNDLELLATLHDIGKMSIDAEILSKPGKLSDEEWAEMRKHPEVGFRIAQATSELIPIADYILCHHERWDGKGYPQGLIGEKIPLLSRIVAVVDSFDAMTSNRAYRSAMTKEEAINEIRRCSGTQFDPEVTRVFIEKVLGQEWEQLNKI
jgi:diguanylate cyclase (GGDEF)-like protein/PAS domain S-box-containing protein